MPVLINPAKYIHLLETTIQYIYSAYTERCGKQFSTYVTPLQVLI